VSTVDSDLEAPGAAGDTGAPGTEVTAARLARVGDLDVRRLLPLRQRRSVGAWCFVDHYGPASVDGVAGPLGETLLMWWNFVGRAPDDITTAARDWATGQRFGTVSGYHGAPLAAPPLDPVRLARKAR
jgi:hypothetical protein